MLQTVLLMLVLLLPGLASSAQETAPSAFAGEETAAAPEAASEPQPEPILDESWAERFLPEDLVANGFAGLAYWQWMLILGTLFLGLLLDLTLRSVLRGAWSYRFKRKGRELPEKQELNRAVRPFGQAAAASIWLAGIHLLQMPDLVTEVLGTAVRLYLMLSVVWAAYRVTDLVSAYALRRASRTENKVDDLLVPLLRKTFKVFFTVLGLVYIADSLSIEVMPLLTGLGIGGLAFAFAAKDTIENFFGSVAVILDRPFQVGDWVDVDGVEGTVEELGLRSTRIRTFYNSVITVPNSTLVRAKVDNYGRRKYRRFKTTLGVTYSTPPERVEQFCEGIREIVRCHPYTRKDYYHCWLNGFGPSSLDILLYVFHETPDWATELRERHRLMLDIMRLADKLGVEFAFPTQTLHIARASDPSPEPSDIANHDDLRKMIEGRRAARTITSDARWRKNVPGPVSFGGSDAIDAAMVEADESSIRSDQTEAKP